LSREDRWESTESGKDLEITVHGRLIVSDAQMLVDAAVVAPNALQA
jgi:hypothetical protein